MYDYVNRDGASSFVHRQTGKTALRMGTHRGPMLGHRDFATFFDDFMGDVLQDPWSGAKGSDAEGVVPTIVTTAAPGGLVRLTTGDAGTGTAADASSLTQSMHWRASNGGLYMEARLKINTAVTNICLNVGFTDVRATVTLEMPFTISGTTITSAASDAVCFVFDTAQTNDFFHLQGVKADTDTALLNSGVAPVADTFIVLGIEIDTAGTAKFYIDDMLYGTVANAVTTSTSMTPIIAAEARTTTSKVVDIDYVFISQYR